MLPACGAGFSCSVSDPCIEEVIDTYTKVVFAKLYDRKTPITAAGLLNDRVVPFLIAA
jgi:hypothetical protein